MPGDSPTLKRFAIELATHYANLCDQVFAPSESIQALLQERGVHSPIAVVPTGIHLERFAQGDGRAWRREAGIPEDAWVIGHLGRLAPEKNLEFLAQAAVDFIGRHAQAHFLVIGSGPSEKAMREIFARAGLEAHLHIAGILQRQELADALHAMDVFAFASRSETQGMVLTEAMAAGVPVVGLDAPGVREVVRDRHNGRLLFNETVDAFTDALQWIASLSPEKMQQLRCSALQTAEVFSMARTADKALACYEALCAQAFIARPQEYEQWQRVFNLLKAEWDILKGMVGAAGAAFGETGPLERTPP